MTTPANCDHIEREYHGSLEREDLYILCVECSAYCEVESVTGDLIPGTSQTVTWGPWQVDPGNPNRD